MTWFHLVLVPNQNQNQLSSCVVKICQITLGKRSDLCRRPTEFTQSVLIRTSMFQKYSRPLLFFKSIYLQWCTDTPQRILLGFHATHRNAGQRAACNRICTCWVIDLKPPFAAISSKSFGVAGPSCQVHILYRGWFSLCVCSFKIEQIHLWTLFQPPTSFRHNASEAGWGSSLTHFSMFH